MCTHRGCRDSQDPVGFMSSTTVLIGASEFRSLPPSVTVALTALYGLAGEPWSRNMVPSDWSGHSSNGRSGGEIRGTEPKWPTVLKQANSLNSASGA